MGSGVHLQEGTILPHWLNQGLAASIHHWSLSGVGTTVYPGNILRPPTTVPGKTETPLPHPSLCTAHF